MRKRVGVIDIGSDDIKLNIAERSAKGMKNIDTLVKHLSLGQDTFMTGKITFESADETAQILQGFCRVMREYNVSDCLAVTTTAVREAENRPFIIDQLKIKTGLDIDVIDNRREKIEINKMMYAGLSEKLGPSALLVHLGGGTMGLSVFSAGEITDTLTIFTSPLRLSKQFESRNIDHLYYSDVIKEYLEGYLMEIDKFLDTPPENFAITGSNVDLMIKMCGIESGDIDIIEKNSFNDLYRKVKNKSPKQISETYEIPVDTAEVILPAIVILNRLVKYTKTDKLFCPHITLGEAIAYNVLFPKESEQIENSFAEFSIISAKKICKRFQTNSEHDGRVAKTALMLFDRLKKHHGLGKNERLLLHLACLLQNCGKFISVAKHNFHSYNIINGLNIVGIDDSQRRILALITLYHNKDPKLSDGLTEQEFVLIAKLSIILRLANSINKSYGKGIERIETALRGGQLTITLYTYKNIELEKWSFLASAPFFREIYGLEVELKKRSVM